MKRIITLSILILAFLHYSCNSNYRKNGIDSNLQSDSHIQLDSSYIQNFFQPDSVFNGWLLIGCHNEKGMLKTYICEINTNKDSSKIRFIKEINALFLKGENRDYYIQAFNNYYSKRFYYNWDIYIPKDEEVAICEEIYILGRSLNELDNKLNKAMRQSVAFSTEQEDLENYRNLPISHYFYEVSNRLNYIAGNYVTVEIKEYYFTEIGRAHPFNFRFTCTIEEFFDNLSDHYKLLALAHNDQYYLFKNQLDSNEWVKVKKELYFLASGFNPDDPLCDEYIVHGTLENYDTIDIDAELNYSIYLDKLDMKIAREHYQDILYAIASIYDPYGACYSGNYMYYSNLGPLKEQYRKYNTLPVSEDTLERLFDTKLGAVGKCYIGPYKCAYLVCNSGYYLLSADGMVTDIIEKINSEEIIMVEWIDKKSLPADLININMK